MKPSDPYSLPIDPQAGGILDYLANQLPDYPYDAQIDMPFVLELLDDFSSLDILEEIKTLRWYADNQPFKNARSPRATIRRWLARAPYRYRTPHAIR